MIRIVTKKCSARKHAAFFVGHQSRSITNEVSPKIAKSSDTRKKYIDHSALWGIITREVALEIAESCDTWKNEWRREKSFQNVDIG